MMSDAKTVVSYAIENLSKTRSMKCARVGEGNAFAYPMDISG